MPTDTLYQALLAESPDSRDRAIAERYAPIILFDRHEPFLPLAAGYTVFRSDGLSPSFSRQVQLRAPERPAAELVIEYAIWWDWDIQHLYELEHVWVAVDADGRVVHADASWHGGMHPMLYDSAVRLEGDHIIVYASPASTPSRPTRPGSCSARRTRAAPPTHWPG
jgi:hypothetical protein